MKMKALPRLKWRDEYWTGSFGIPFFDDYGSLITELEGDNGAAKVSESLELCVFTTTRKEVPPTREHKAAWTEIMSRGVSIWEEAVVALLSEYNLQWPRRIQYWRTIRGPQAIARTLPVVRRRTQFQKLIKPIGMWIHAPATNGINVDLRFVATWHQYGVCVCIRNGQISNVIGMDTENWRSPPWIEHPVFGFLHFHQGAWLGVASLEGFRTFADLSVDRSSWDESGWDSITPVSDLDWSVARGEFLILILGRVETPTRAQVNAFESLCLQGKVVVEMMKEALFKSYSQKKRSKKYNLKNGTTSKSVRSAADIPQFTDLCEVNIHLEDKHGSVALGFIFKGHWTGVQGVGIRYKNGKLVAIGGSDIARNGE